MLQLWERGQSHASRFPSWNRNWYTTLRSFLSLYLFFSVTMKHTLSHSHFWLSSGVRKEDMSHQSNPPGVMGTCLPLCSIWHEDCALLGNEIEMWSVHHALGWWQRIFRGDCFPVCRLCDTCVAMWRTVLAVLPEIANPLSLEMSCVAWPRAAQACSSHPPRSQELSLQYCLLPWLSLPEMFYCRSQCCGEYNYKNRLLLVPHSWAVSLVVTSCNNWHF